VESNETQNEACSDCDSGNKSAGKQNYRTKHYNNVDDIISNVVYDLRFTRNGFQHKNTVLNDDVDINEQTNWKWFYHHKEQCEEFDCNYVVTYSPSDYYISVHVFKYLMYFKVPVLLQQ
jgi:hypothetical protein